MRDQLCQCQLILIVRFLNQLDKLCRNINKNYWINNNLKVDKQIIKKIILPIELLLDCILVKAGWAYQSLINLTRVQIKHRKIINTIKRENNYFKYLKLRWKSKESEIKTIIWVIFAHSTYAQTTQFLPRAALQITIHINMKWCNSAVPQPNLIIFHLLPTAHKATLQI